MSGLAVPWHVTAYRWGLPVQFAPDALDVPDDPAAVKLLVQHDDDRPVGFGESFTVTDPGLRGLYRVPAGFARGIEALAEADGRLRDGLSIGVELYPATLDALWDALWDGPETDAAGNPVPLTLAGLLRETSLVSLPQFIDARTDHAAPVAVFTSSPPVPNGVPNGVPSMTNTLIPPAPIDSTPPGAGDHTPGQAMSMADLAAQLRPFMAGVNVAGAGHPASRWSSLGALLMAARDDRGAGVRTDDGSRVALALADQITGNNPGVLPPTWLSEVVGIINRGRPVVTAFGGPASAGSSGMSVSWPYYDGDLEALVNEQVNEKTEVTTGRVDIKSDSADLKTYAGASDISYQLLRRSSPSYREIYARILSLAFAARTDNVFSAALAAVAAANPDNPEWDGATAESLTAALFAASTVVDDAAGVPGSIALAAPDVFALIGSGLGLYPPVYGTNNVPGTAQASTLRVNVSGLEITKARHLAAGTLIVSTPEAATWREDGPYAVEADDVAVLGRDVGIWGMGTSTITVPGAVVGVSVTVVPPLSRGPQDTDDSTTGQTGQAKSRK